MRLRLIPLALISSCYLTSCINSSKNPKAYNPCGADKYSPSEIFKNSLDSVVVVRTEESQGSGFVVSHADRYTLVLTNSHVVDGEDSVKIKWSDGRVDTGKVVGDYGADKLDRDVALILVDAIRGKPLKRQPKAPEIGSDVVVIGAPQGLEFSLTRGVLSQIRQNGDFLQIDAPINPGNSGGPLFDSTGCVAGMITFKKSESEGLNFAIGYEPIQKFLTWTAIERKPKSPKKRFIAYYPYILDLASVPPPIGPVPRPPGEGWTLKGIKCRTAGIVTKKLCGSGYWVSNKEVRHMLDNKVFAARWYDDYLVFKDGFKTTEFAWIRFLGRRGSLAHYEERFTRINAYSDRQERLQDTTHYRHVVDCENWLRSMESLPFQPIIPGSIGETYAKDACLTGTEVEVEVETR